MVRMRSCYSKCGPGSKSISITWGLVRNADSQAPLQNDNLHFNKVFRWLTSHWSLSSSGLDFAMVWNNPKIFFKNKDFFLTHGERPPGRKGVASRRLCFILFTRAPGWWDLLNITSHVAGNVSVWLSRFSHISSVKANPQPCLSLRRWEEQSYHVPGRMGIKILMRAGDPRGSEDIQRLLQYRCEGIRYCESISIGR